MAGRGRSQSLTVSEIGEIQRLYFEDRWTQSEIAAELKIAQTTVSQALRRSRQSIPEPDVGQIMLERWYSVNEDIMIARQRWHNGQRGAGRDYARLLDYEARNFFPSIRVVMGSGVDGAGVQSIEFLEDGKRLPDDDPRVLALLHRQSSRAYGNEGANGTSASNGHASGKTLALTVEE